MAAKDEHRRVAGTGEDVERPHRRTRSQARRTAEDAG
jgi:hypothetical protein